MKSRILPLFLLFAMVLSTGANAATRALRVTPALVFRGTTAYCEVYITSGSDPIEATLELWDGDTLIDSWSGEGEGQLYLSGTSSVKKGVTYTLEVHGTVDGRSFSATPVVNVC